MKFEREVEILYIYDRKDFATKVVFAIKSYDDLGNKETVTIEQEMIHNFKKRYNMDDLPSSGYVSKSLTKADYTIFPFSVRKNVHYTYEYDDNLYLLCSVYGDKNPSINIMKYSKDEFDVEPKNYTINNIKEIKELLWSHD